jgi:hypothetical protein
MCIYTTKLGRNYLATIKWKTIIFILYIKNENEIIILYWFTYL